MVPESPDRYPVNGPLVTIARHGQSYLIHQPGGHIGIPIADGRPYESRLLDVMYGLRLSGSALDIGAHVGNHTLFLAAVCGLTVYALEPGERAYEMLLANIRVNGGIADRIMPYRMAAGAGYGSGRLDRAMTVHADPDGDVPIAAIDDEFDIPDLVLVKIDVEGGEPAVLAGMTRHLDRCSPIVFTEVHGRTAHRAQIAVLGPLGYRETARIPMGSLMLRWDRTG